MIYDTIQTRQLNGSGSGNHNMLILFHCFIAIDSVSFSAVLV